MKKLSVTDLVGIGLASLGVVIALASWIVRVGEDRRIEIEGLGCVAFWNDDCDTLGDGYLAANILLGLGVVMILAGAVVFFVFRAVRPGNRVSNSGASHGSLGGTKFCSGCGLQLDSSAAFCSRCGLQSA